MPLQPSVGLPFFLVLIWLCCVPVSSQAPSSNNSSYYGGCIKPATGWVAARVELAATRDGQRTFVAATVTSTGVFVAVFANPPLVLFGNSDGNSAVQQRTFDVSDGDTPVSVTWYDFANETAVPSSGASWFRGGVPLVGLRSGTLLPIWIDATDEPPENLNAWLRPVDVSGEDHALCASSPRRALLITHPIARCVRKVDLSVFPAMPEVFVGSCKMQTSVLQYPVATADAGGFVYIWDAGAGRIFRASWALLNSTEQVASVTVPRTAAPHSFTAANVHMSGAFVDGNDFLLLSAQPCGMIEIRIDPIKVESVAVIDVFPPNGTSVECIWWKGFYQSGSYNAIRFGIANVNNGTAVVSSLNSCSSLLNLEGHACPAVRTTVALASASTTITATSSPTAKTELIVVENGEENHVSRIQGVAVSTSVSATVVGRDQAARLLPVTAVSGGEDVTATVYTEGTLMAVGRSGFRTVAGTREHGYSDGHGVDILFGSERVTLAALSGTGDYIVDTANHCIRFFTRGPEVVSTISGNCTDRGFADGSASAARYNTPYAVTAVPPANSRGRWQSVTLHICDRNGIRRLNVDSGAVVTVFEPGNDTKAYFSFGEVEYITFLGNGAQREGLYVVATACFAYIVDPDSRRVEFAMPRGEIDCSSAIKGVMAPTNASFAIIRQAPDLTVSIDVSQISDAREGCLGRYTLPFAPTPAPTTAVPLQIPSEAQFTTMAPASEAPNQSEADSEDSGSVTTVAIIVVAVVVLVIVIVGAVVVTRFMSKSKGEATRRGTAAEISRREEQYDSEQPSTAAADSMVPEEMGPRIVADTAPPTREDVLRNIQECSFTKLQLVGRGAFGKVHRILLDSGGVIAAKEIPLPEHSDEELQTCISREVELMCRLQHPNVIQCFGSTIEDDGSCAQIFMELASGGSLSSLAKEMSEKATESRARVYLRQVLEGLAYIHDQDVLHRDLKCDNVLLTTAGKVKIADFGTSRVIQHTTRGGTRKMRTLAGTAYFMAPEVILDEEDVEEEAFSDPEDDGDGGDTGGVEKTMSQSEDEKRNPSTVGSEERLGYGRKADVWSFGILCLEFMNRGKAPWPSFANPALLLIHISGKDGIPLVPQDTTPAYRSFIARCCNRDVAARATARELLDDPWWEN